MLHSRPASSLQLLLSSGYQVPRAPFSRPRHAQHNRPVVTLTPPNMLSPAPIVALPAGESQAGYHVCRAVQEAGSAADDDGKVFTLPLAASESAAEAFAAAAAAAEAAQQQLMTNGPLADEMRQNQLLRRVMEAYSTLQCLYHKALLPLIQRHDNLAATVAGFTYALFSEEVKWAVAKAAGEQIHMDELVEMDAHTETLTFDPFEAPLYNVAHNLLTALVMKGRGAAKPSDCLVLGDAVTVITQEGDFPSDDNEVTDSLKRATVQLMSAAFQPGTCVPKLGSDSAVGLQTEPEGLLAGTAFVAVRLGASIQSAKLMRDLRDTVLDTLSSEADKSSVMTALKEFNTWDTAAHSNPFRTESFVRFSLAKLVFWLARCCLHSALAGVLYHTTLQQLLGATSMTDWRWVEGVLTVVAAASETEAEASWARAELKLLSTLQQSVEGVHDPAKIIDTFTEADALRGLAAAATHLMRIEVVHNAFFARLKSREMERLMTHFTDLAAMALDCYLDLELNNFLDVIDSEGGCWPFLFYYLDIRQLALQLAGGKAGPAAVKAANMLMGEKHSVFVARWAMRMYSILSPSFATRSQAILFVSTAPLQWDAHLRHLIIARGNTKTANTLAAYYPKVPNQIQASATCTLPATAASTMQDWFSTALQQTAPPGVNSKQFLLETLSAADSPESAPPELSHTFELLQRRLTPNDAQCMNNGAQCAWFTTALAQYRVLQQASSPAVARLLLATENTGQEYIRPVHDFVATKKAQAGLLADAICDLAWSLPSSTAAALAACSEQPIMMAPATSNTLSSILWVAGAASTTPLHEWDPDRNLLDAFAVGMGATREAAHGRLLVNFDEYFLLRLAYEYGSHGMCDQACSFLLSILDGRPFSTLQPATQAALLGALRLVLAQMIKQQTSVPKVVQQLLQIVPVMDSKDLVPLAKHALVHDEERLAACLSLFIEQVSEQLGALSDAVVDVLVPVFQTLTCHIQQQELTMVWEAAADDRSGQPPMNGSKHAVLTAGHQAIQTSAGSTNAPDKPLGPVLLGVVCGVLEYERVGPMGQQQLIQSVLLPLLRLYQQHAPLPQKLSIAVGAAAATEIKAGTMALLDEFLDTWQQLQLRPSDVTDVLSGALQNAAEHSSTVDTPAATGRQVFFQVWSKALPTWETIRTMGGFVGITRSCAAAILTAMQRSDTIAGQLLQDKWPLQVLGELIESASDRLDTVGVSKQERAGPVGQQQLIHGILLPLLRLYQQHAPLPKKLSIAFGAAAATEIKAGTMALLDEFLDTWQQLQLQPSDVTDVLSRALQNAAKHSSTVDTPAARAVLLQVWSRALPLWETMRTLGDIPCIRPACATAILTAMQCSDTIAGQLLQDKWPLQVLSGLIESALDHRGKVGEVSILLLHAQHYGMLRDLEPGLLSNAAAAVPSCYSSLVWDATALLLQQDMAPRPQVAAALLQAIKESEGGAARSEQWQLLQQCLGTCSTSVAHTFLCSLLEASTAVSDQQQSWQLYGLLQHCQQDSKRSGKQLKLPTKTVCALIEHQGDAAQGPAADKTGRILQIWTAFAESSKPQNGGYAAAAKLSAGAQRAVVTAAVAAGLHDDAVRFVEEAPIQLSHLISLWEHHQIRHPIPSSALVAALQLAAKLGAAAAAVGRLLQVLWQQPDHAAAAKLLPVGTAAQLVKDLSKQDQLHTAQQLLSSSVVSRQPAHLAAVSVAKFVSAVAQHAAAGQQLALVAAAVQLGPESRKDATKHLQQDLLLQTLDQLLQIQDVAAVAMLLQVAAAAAGSIRGVLAVLSDTQLEQLTSMCCANAASHALPTPIDLAQHFVDIGSTSRTVFPDAVVAAVANALSMDRPELQPHRAAQLLGLTSGVVDAVPPGPDEKNRNSSSVVDVPRAEWPSRGQDLGWLLAALSLHSIPAETGADTVMDAPAWVQLLTYEAAAAALFACWHLSHSDTSISTTSSIHHSRIPCLPNVPLPPAAVVGRRCLQLYQHARHCLHSKPSLDSLLLDLGLAAAADAAAWKEGEDIVSAANYIMARGSDISTPSTTRAKAQSAQLQQHWVPLLPAARPALVRVLVHTYGIDRTAQLLLKERERLLEPHTHASSRSKGQKGAALTSAITGERVKVGPLLISTPVVNSFLSASLEVSQQLKQTTLDEEEASAIAATAITAAEVLLSKQVIAMSLAATVGQASSELPLSPVGTSHSSLGADLLRADAETWASLAELYGAAVQYRKLANLVTVAVQKRLPLSRSTSGASGASDSSRRLAAAQAHDLQVVLAGAAAAWHAAGAESGVFAMLDGMVAAGAMQLTNPRLAAMLLEAANTDDEALASRLEGGLDAVYGEALEQLAKLMDYEAATSTEGPAAGGSRRYPAVQLVAANGLPANSLMLQLQQMMDQSASSVVRAP